ncbi:hypothetical protein PanWU01x14_190250 [Parasponia andersonii]|uniref:Uncharacterized protein n=1 Tax=Parasponia andersonii TaxID=3476 RepID=A0A2P5C213_PARAD|nr:hypothetical protein PanWU01x14_190250 [Parasponia andersonii]
MLSDRYLSKLGMAKVLMINPRERWKLREKRVLRELRERREMFKERVLKERVFRLVNRNRRRKRLCYNWNRWWKRLLNLGRTWILLGNRRGKLFLWSFCFWRIRLLFGNRGRKLFFGSWWRKWLLGFRGFGREKWVVFAEMVPKEGGSACHRRELELSGESKRVFVIGFYGFGYNLRGLQAIMIRTWFG